MLTVKQQVPFVNSNISYTVQIIGIILRSCLKKKRKKRKENIDTVETNIFAKE